MWTASKLFPLIRSLFWSLALPLAGMILLGATNPLFGFFILRGFRSAPTTMLAVVYMLGLVPSIVTSAAFFVLRRGYGVRLGLVLTCCVAALASTAWWRFLDWQFWTDDAVPTWWISYMATIAVLATTLLAFDSRLSVRRGSSSWSAGA